MFYIKLDENMDLVITKREPIYRGDNLNQKITYLVPLMVGEINPETAYLYLSYVRADGTPDIVVLERLEEKYNESYYQYTLPVTCKLTRYAGEICTWLQIYSGDLANPAISKSGECVLHVQESKNMDDYFSDEQMTALYQLNKKMETSLGDMQDTIETKADDIIFDEDGSTIQLSSGGTPIGEKVVINTSDKWTNIGDTENEETANYLWEQM